jgi:hypothetical protein
MILEVGSGKTYSTIAAALAALYAYIGETTFTETHDIKVFDGTYDEMVIQGGLVPTLTNRLRIYGAPGSRPKWAYTGGSVGCIWVRHNYTDIFNFRFSSNGYIGCIYGEGTSNYLRIYNNIFYSGKACVASGNYVYQYNNIIGRNSSFAGIGTDWIFANNTLINNQGLGTQSSPGGIMANNIFSGDSTGYATFFIGPTIPQFYRGDYNLVTRVGQTGFTYNAACILLNTNGEKAMMIKSLNAGVWTCTVENGSSTGKKFTLVQGATTEIYDNQNTIAAAVSAINTASTICLSISIFESTLANITLIGRSDYQGTLAIWQANGMQQESHSIEVLTEEALLLENFNRTIPDTPTAQNNYRPTATSPAVGAGIDLSEYFTTDMNGEKITAWHIGALAPLTTAGGGGIARNRIVNTGGI